MNASALTSRTGGAGRLGVRIVGTGSCLPDRRLTNADLERLMDTSDEWIVQRTGVRERRLVDPSKGECTRTLSAEALRQALRAARLNATDLDLLVIATMTPEMGCPPTSCLVAGDVGAASPAAFDLNAACSGFVFALNTVHELVRGGLYRTAALIGADTLSVHMDYSTPGRGTAILFGDAAAAVVMRATDDASKGLIAQAMHTNGAAWKEIYIPESDRHFPPGVACDPSKFGRVQMNGAGVFKFAVTTFSDLIQETLDKAGLRSDEIDMFVCHQSNARILSSARERFGIPAERLHVNIDRVGNTVAASVPLCLDELVREGRVREGHKVMFLGFGGGLTWGSSLWQF